MLGRACFVLGKDRVTAEIQSPGKQSKVPGEDSKGLAGTIMSSENGALLGHNGSLRYRLH